MAGELPKALDAEAMVLMLAGTYFAHTAMWGQVPENWPTVTVHAAWSGFALR